MESHQPLVRAEKCLQTFGCCGNGVQHVSLHTVDEYVYHIPNPKHMPKYAEVKVLVPKLNTHS